jgi:predicted DNA-binding transcriptional regulator AlpA
LITGISRAHCWREELAGRFPRRLSLGPKTVRWRLSEIMKWMGSLTPVEDLPKPIRKSANLGPRASKATKAPRQFLKAKREVEAEPQPEPSAKASRPRRKTRSKAVPT